MPDPRPMGRRQRGPAVPASGPQDNLRAEPEPPHPLETGSRPRVARALSGLRAQVIHGDMSLDNVLVER